MNKKNKNWLFGVGLKPKYNDFILNNKVEIDFFEVITENFFLQQTGSAVKILQFISNNYKLSLHSVGASLGSIININHLQKIKDLYDKFHPFLISEHIAWSQASQKDSYLHDLLPVVYNKASLSLLCDNVKKFQDFLGRYIIMENPALYLTYNESDMMEFDFINKLIDVTGCGLILDINNIDISCNNIGDITPEYYLDNINLSKVEEIHLAGYHEQNLSDNKIIRVDTHNGNITDYCWELYFNTMTKLHKINNPVATLIEWDQNPPNDFRELEKLALKAKKGLEERKIIIY